MARAPLTEHLERRAVVRLSREAITGDLAGPSQRGSGNLSRVDSAADARARLRADDTARDERDDEVGDTLLSVLCPAWESGEVDVPAVLLGVETAVGGDAAPGGQRSSHVDGEDPPVRIGLLRSGCR